MNNANDREPLEGEEEFPKNTSYEMLRLFGALVDDGLSQKDAQKLSELLARDDETCRLYLDYVDAHARCVMHFEMAADVQAETTLPSPRSPINSLLHRAKDLWSRPAPLSLTIAALVVGIVVGIAAFIAPPVYRQFAGSEVPHQLRETEHSVAQLTGVENVKWSIGQLEVKAGAKLHVGDTVALRSGLAEITFALGTTVLVEGPCEFMISSNNAGFLRDGKLVAQVPTRAKGFVVVTPLAKLIDFGTEFGVRVATEEVEAQVFVGEVLVEPIRQTRRESLQLKEGERVVVNQRGVSRSNIAVNSTQFVRRTGLVNLAKGKLIVAATPWWEVDGESNNAYEPKNALDNRTSDEMGTFWLGRETTNDEYFTVDLEETIQIDRIELVPTHNGPPNDRGTKNYEIWVAERIDSIGDLVQPQLIAQGTLPNVAGQASNLPSIVVSRETVNGDGKAIRYLKFVARTYYGRGSGLSELRVFGKAAEISEPK